MPLLLLLQILKSVLLGPVQLGHQVCEALGKVFLAQILVPLKPVLMGTTLFLEEVVLLGVFFNFVLLQELG